MNLDEQLPGLLAREAEHADVAPPTMDGVQSRVGRRARHRQRQRRVGTGLAALCLVAGVAGGLVLAGGDEPPGNPVDGPVLPDVPLLGVDVSGLTLTDADRGPLGESDTGAQHVYAVFTEPSASLTGPVITAGIDPDIEPFAPLEREDGVPVDLDGDATTDGPADGRLLRTDGGRSLIWLTADGRRAGVGGTGITEDDFLAYVRDLDRATFDVRTIATPGGLTHREVVTIPSEVGAEEAYAQYEGLGGSMVVLVTNTPGWFDLTRSGVVYDSDVELEQVALGSSLLGPGTALVGVDRNTTATVVRTESGLAVQITAFDLAPDVVRDILVDGRFIEVEPTTNPLTDDEPTTPTTSMPSTTAVPTSDLIAISEPGCASPAGSPTSLADEPVRWLRFGTYDRWRDLDGCPVRIDVISSSAGPGHCDWEAAHFITIGDPLGTSIRAGGQPGRRRYVWNGDGVLTGLPPGRTIPVLDAAGGRLGTEELYVTTEDTGYRWGDRELWIDPDDGATLYVVDGDEARVYVRNAEAGICE